MPRHFHCFPQRFNQPINQLSFSSREAEPGILSWGNYIKTKSSKGAHKKKEGVYSFPNIQGNFGKLWKEAHR